MREGIYRKTEAGKQEISQRTRKLAAPLRTTLLMVDGQRTLAQLREVMDGVRAPGDTLEQLLADGLIELVPTGFSAAGLVDVVGPRVGTGAAPAAAAAPAQAAPAPVHGAQAPDSGKYLFLYEHMSEAVRAHLGLRGYFMQLKVERCTTAAQLEALLPEFREALVNAKGHGFVADWERALEAMA